MDKREKAKHTVIVFIVIECILAAYWFIISQLYTFKENHAALPFKFFPLHFVVPGLLSQFLEELYKSHPKNSTFVFQTRHIGWILALLLVLLVDVDSLIYHIHEFNKEGWDILGWLGLGAWILATADTLASVVIAIVLTYNFSPPIVLGTELRKANYDPIHSGF